MPDTQQERVQEKCVVSGTPSLIRVAFVHLKNKKKNACYAGQLLRNEDGHRKGSFLMGRLKLKPIAITLICRMSLDWSINQSHY